MLGQRATAEKSNEKTAIPESLATLALEGCIVTIDAIGTQANIADDQMRARTGHAAHNLAVLRETLIKSFPRRRGSSKLLKPWIPAFAGMTKSGLPQRFLKHITLNLIRLDPVKRKGGIKARRLIAATSDSYRAQLLGLA